MIASIQNSVLVRLILFDFILPGHFLFYTVGISW